VRGGEAGAQARTLSDKAVSLQMCTVEITRLIVPIGTPVYDEVHAHAADQALVTKAVPHSQGCLAQPRVGVL
jgi:hypothetical protein